MTNLDKLEEVKDLRTVWPHEALDFTPWLAEDDNITLLGNVLGLDITVDETESSVGSFNVDMYASETGTERKIIIENQLEETNHDHLGKLITYAAGKTANIVIWIVKRAREEHKAAIEWLNNHTDDNIGFFLCEIKLYRIGNSAPAAKFEVIEKPNDWAKEIKKNDGMKPIQQQRLDYWTAFNDYAFQDTAFTKQFNRRKPSSDHWMDFAIGMSSCHLAVSQISKRNEVDVELYISEDKELFHDLFSKKEIIEQQAGISFDWLELPDKKASRIIAKRTANISDKNDWENQFEWIMKTLISMKTTFKKYL